MRGPCATFEPNFSEIGVSLGDGFFPGLTQAVLSPTRNPIFVKKAQDAPVEKEAQDAPVQEIPRDSGKVRRSPYVNNSAFRYVLGLAIQMLP